jgi:hypothetical protein
VIDLFIGTIFAIWSGASLFTGKIFDPKAGWFGEMVYRRKSPIWYWTLIAMIAGMAVVFFGVALRDLS